MGPKAKPAKEDERVDTTSTRPTEGEGASGTGSSAEGVVSELASMMKTLLHARIQESIWEKVVQSQDQCWKAMNHQFQLLQGQVGDIQGSESSRANTPQLLVPTGDYRETRFKDPKLHPLSNDDIEHFLAMFESTWAIRLVPLLTRKARRAIVAMDMEDTDDYTLVKEAIEAKRHQRFCRVRHQENCTSD